MKRLIIPLFFVNVLAFEVQAQNIHYVELGARTMSMDAVGSFPQKILSIEENSDSLKVVKLSTFNEWEDSTAVFHLSNTLYNPNKNYPDSIEQYLNPTRLINCNSSVTKHIADSLFDGNEVTLYQIIDKALQFSASIIYDESLANDISNGKILGKSSDISIKKMSGTCGESANVFIAIMRYMRVPTRFVTGYIWNEAENISSGHAWAEVFLDGFGWWAVNPQSAGTALPYYAYKILAGRDIEHLGIEKLTDMFINEKRWLIIREYDPNLIPYFCTGFRDEE